jgi:hypothetical protein
VVLDKDTSHRVCVQHLCLRAVSSGLYATRNARRAYQKRLRHKRRSKLRIPPQPLKPCRVGGSVPDGVLNIPMPQVVLDEPRVRALVGEGVAAGVAEHVGMGFDGQACESAIVADHHPGGLAVQRPAPFTHEESVGVGLHPGAVGQPCFDGAYLVVAQGVRGGQAVGGVSNVDTTARRDLICKTLFSSTSTFETLPF